MCCKTAHFPSSRLEYKYSKLVAPNKDGELPGVDTCALDDDEDEEQFDSVQFSENKGRKFFNKIKNIAKKVSNLCQFCVPLPHRLYPLATWLCYNLIPADLYAPMLVFPLC